MTFCLIKETYTSTHGEIMHAQTQLKKEIIEYIV